jgi:hypothetical protein
MAVVRPEQLLGDGESSRVRLVLVWETRDSDMVHHVPRGFDVTNKSGRLHRAPALGIGGDPGTVRKGMTQVESVSAPSLGACPCSLLSSLRYMPRWFEEYKCPASASELVSCYCPGRKTLTGLQQVIGQRSIG